MLYVCPGCQRSFDEAGFCPFDRSELVQMSELRTIVTGPMRAVAGPHTTAIERHGTFPLTPSPRTGEAAASPAPAPAEAKAEAKVEATKNLRAGPASDGPPASGAALDPLDLEEDVAYDRLVGQTLDGRYYIQLKIGEGGMGVVFSARHAVIERPLAIKVLKRQVMRDTATIRRFVQEAKAASRIGHPNIVDVTDFGTTPDGMTYSVMEYVDGQTLGTALRHSAPFPMPRAVRIAAQIARALGAAHDKGIVHRDLKPENVFLVERDGRPDFVKIVDFGIAKVTPLPGSSEPRLTRAGSVFGTPEYMAPEQAAGRGDTDGRVDVYALGVILYEMVTGRVPHKGDSMVRTLAMQMLDPAEPPRRVRPDLDISPELEALIMKALAKRREDRFQTMGELLAALDRLQVPVGLSVTGSPVYALVPLPPGADPALASPAPPGIDASAPSQASQPEAPIPALDGSAPIPVPMPITGQRARTPSGVGDRPRTPSGAGDRPRTPTGPTDSGARRLKDEPEFVSSGRPFTFEPAAPEPPAPVARRPGPVLLLFALILGGAAGALALVIWSRGHADDDRPRDTAELPAARADAAIVLALAPDAATAVALADPPDAAVPPTDAAIVPPVRRHPVEIQVLTRPEGATLYVGAEYLALGGAPIRKPFGTTLVVTCRQTGYKPGAVKLVFDGKRATATCVLERIGMCIPGIKNPYDQCPE